MKISAFLPLLAGCTLCLAPLSTAADPAVPHGVRIDQIAVSPHDAHRDDDPPYGVRIDQIARSQSAEIRPGLAQSAVARYLGSAHRKLSRNVWLYHNFFADSDEANARGCSKLLLTFADGKLVELKIVNAAAVKLIAADLRQQDQIRRLAGK